MKESNPARVGLLIGLLALAVAAPGVADGRDQPSSIPLAIGTISIDPAKHVATFPVTNNGTKGITAWGFQATVRDPKGESVSFHQEDDGFLAADVPGVGVLDPGAVRDIRLGLPTNIEPSDVKVTVAAVIFDDVSSSGNPTTIDRIMTRRIAEREALRQLRGQLVSAIVRHSGKSMSTAGDMSAETAAEGVSESVRVAAVRDFAAQLGSGPPTSRAAGSLRHDVERVTAMPAGPERARQISQLIRVLDVECENATKHSRRPQ